jgi:hypothetical protein
LNATIFDNDFTNSNAAVTGEEFLIEASDGGDIVMNLSGNSANSGGAPDGDGVFRLVEVQAVGSVFSIFERDATIITETRNTGTVITVPDDAAFDSAPTAPPTP